MGSLENNSYHGFVLSIKKHPQDDDLKVIKILPEGIENQPAKEYEVLDFLLETTDDKIIEKHVYIKENTEGTLMKVFLDVSKEPINNINPKLLYRYDDEIVNDYYDDHLFDIEQRLYQQVTNDLDKPENITLIKNMLQEIPAYIKAYFYLARYDSNQSFSPYESARIHFVYYAYKLAQEDLNTANIQETDVHQLYEDYIGKSFEKDNVLPRHIFFAYINIFKNEIIHASKNHTTSLRDQKSIAMYESLYPDIKYYLFHQEFTFPLSRIEQNYITTLYYVQDIYKRYHKTRMFSEVMEVLLEAANDRYKYHTEDMYYTEDDSGLCVFDEDLHADYIFDNEKGVHLVLDSFFSSVCRRLYAKSEREGKIYSDLVIDEINQKFTDSEKIQRFLYCVYILDGIYQKSIAN